MITIAPIASSTAMSTGTQVGLGAFASAAVGGV